MVNANPDGVSVRHTGRDHRVMYQHVRDASTVIVLCHQLMNLSAIVNPDGPGVIAVSHVQPRLGDPTVKTSAFAGMGFHVIQKLENVMSTTSI